MGSLLQSVLCLFMEDTEVALWNCLKCAIDVYSRYLKNVEVPHKHLHTEGAVWLQLVKTILLDMYIYNLHMHSSTVQQTECNCNYALSYY